MRGHRLAGLAALTSRDEPSPSAGADQDGAAGTAVEKQRVCRIHPRFLEQGLPRTADLAGDGQADPGGRTAQDCPTGAAMEDGLVDHGHTFLWCEAMRVTGIGNVQEPDAAARL